MKKDFDKWNEKKQILHHTQAKFFPHQREIWMCSVGVNVGFEIDGKGESFRRPILILRKFHQGVYALPLTSKECKKENAQWYFKLGSNKSWVILTQLKFISTKRLIRRVKRINSNQFNEIVNKTVGVIKNELPH